MVSHIAVLLLLVSGITVGLGLNDARTRPGDTGFTRPQVEEVLRAHNGWRRLVGVPPLRWALDLAARAQRRAAYLATHGCFIEHGILPEDVGENLYHSGPLRAEGRRNELNPVTPTQVVDAWGAEAADYSPVRDTCAPKRQCGHYTQIVWITTEEVGCGMAVCPTLGQVWVCNYRPKGNVRMIRRPN